MVSRYSRLHLWAPAGARVWAHVSRREFTRKCVHELKKLYVPERDGFVRVSAACDENVVIQAEEFERSHTL